VCGCGDNYKVRRAATKSGQLELRFQHAA